MNLPPQRPLGVTLLAGFFTFGVLMCMLTVLLLLVPGTKMDLIWRVNPEAQRSFASIGGWAFLLMLTTATACAASAVGLWRGAEWGRRMAIAVLLVNLLGDLSGAVLRGDLRTLIGLPISAALIAYLCGRRVRRWTLHDRPDR
ncbi:MAG: hypothetical protein ACR2ID_06350 [Chthoniobacterales bacterium]